MPNIHSGTLLILLLVCLVPIGFVLYRRWQLQRLVQGQFRAFREQAVVLMDQIDALRQRHRTMTSTDPDFDVPMSGATKTLFENVGSDLERLWERWLRVMEVWKRAQERLETSWSLASSPTEEARTLLEGSEIQMLVRDSEACQRQLDRLNRAHETAREELHEARHELADVQNVVSGGTGVLLPTDQHHDVLEQSERALAEADLRIAADPIGAQELIARTRSRLAAEIGKPGRTGWQVGDITSHPIFGELSAAAERLRSAATKLWTTSWLGLFIRAWLIMMALALLPAALLASVPLALFLAAIMIFLMVVRGIVRAQMAWLWGSQRRSVRQGSRWNR